MLRLVEPSLSDHATQEQPVTTKSRPATSAAPRMPWCYHPEMGWYSGEGEGCTPTSSYFVEYR